MRTDLFDFDLPDDRIALSPASPRDAARMLVVQPDGVLRDRTVAELTQWLEPGDQLVVNDTKVISAQLKGRRIGRETEPKIEATLIKRLDGSRWQALVKPAKKLASGDVVRFGNEGKVCLLGHLDAEVVSIAVTEMRENTYYARITLQQNGSEIEVDSRPSDAIALAVRSGAKIYVADEVIEESGVEFEGDASDDEIAAAAGVPPLAELDPDEFRAFLDTVTPDEFASDPEDS